MPNCQITGKYPQSRKVVSKNVIPNPIQDKIENSIRPK